MSSPARSDTYFDTTIRRPKKPAEQRVEGLQLFRRKTGERASDHPGNDLASCHTQLSAFVGQTVVHRPSGSWYPLDQSALDQAAGECAEGLIRLERELREVVQRGVRVLIEMAQRIPLHERDIQRREFRVERAMMPHLEPLDRKADLLEWSRHNVE